MRTWGWAVACLIALAVVIFPRLRTQAESRPAAAALSVPGKLSSAPLSVATYTVVAAPLSETISTTGSLLPDEAVVLQAEVAGRIVAIHFAEGSYVKRGDLLVKLNDAELLAIRARAQHRRELAVIRERRIVQLLEKGVARQEEHDIAANERKVQEAEVALIDAQIGKTEIRAPFDGIVGLRSASSGAFLSAGTRIAILQRVNDLKLEFSLSEQYAARVRPGDRTTFSITGSGRRHQGVVYAVNPQIDTVTRTVTVRALCPNPERELLPGNFATVHLQLGTTMDALLVPAAALVAGALDKGVYVVADGKARRQAVTTGLRLEDSVQILSGLHVGDVVVVSGLQQMRDGALVRSRSLRREGDAAA